MAHCVTQWSFPPVLPTDSGGQDTQCGFASGTANASEWTLVKLLQLFGLSYQNPMVLSKARACAAFCGVVLCASGNHSLPSQKSFQAAKECKQQKSRECSFHFPPWIASQLNLKILLLCGRNPLDNHRQEKWPTFRCRPSSPGTAKSPMPLFRGLDEKKQ